MQTLIKAALFPLALFATSACAEETDPLPVCQFNTRTPAAEVREVLRTFGDANAMQFSAQTHQSRPPFEMYGLSNARLEVLARNPFTAEEFIVSVYSVADARSTAEEYCRELRSRLPPSGGG